MKNKVKKSEELKSLESKLPKSKITIFTSFAREGEKGLSVSQMQELKRALRAMDAQYVVIKKTLIDKALKDLKYDGVDTFSMNGSLGLVVSPEDSDAYAISKKLYEFAKKNQALKYFGAWFEEHFVPESEFTQIALMPSREVLIGRLFGMMKYPLTGLAIVLSEIAKKGRIEEAKAEPSEAKSEEKPEVAEAANSESNNQQ